MWNSRLCKVLGIEYPIVQAPMAWVACAELASAVSEAGGLGTLGPQAGFTSQHQINDLDSVRAHLKEQIQQVRDFTSKPFAVSLTIGWGRQKAINEARMKVIIDEEVPVAVVSMGSPEICTGTLHKAGIKVIHVVTSVRHARNAQESGVDAIACIGYEAGGHIGGDELPTFVLVPQVVDAVNIPVIAGGGVGDARGLAAALALGADGVYIGTRFLATEECRAHPNMKKAIIDAGDSDTVAFGRRTAISRCLRNAYTTKHSEMEAGGASFQVLRDYEKSTNDTDGWHRAPAALMAGNTTYGAAPCSAIAGAIRDIVPAAEVVRRMVANCQEIIAKLDKIAMEPPGNRTFNLQGTRRPFPNPTGPYESTT